MGRIVGAFFLFLVGNALYGQNGCATQPQPIRPATAGAGTNAVLLCLCAQNGLGCHWQWANAALGSTAPQTVIVQPQPPSVDPSLYPQAPPPTRLQSPLEIIRQAEQVKRLRLENQAIQQQNQAAATDVPASETPAVMEPAGLTQGRLNGNGWLRMTPNERIYFLGAIGDVQRSSIELGMHFGTLNYPQIANLVEDFYTDPTNLNLAVIDVLRITSLQRNGASPSEVDQKLAEMRRKLQQANPLQ